MERVVTIELFGRSYTFEAESGTEEASAVADLLVREVERVQSQYSDSGAISEKAVLILAALNIASENHQLRRSCGDMMNRLSRKSAALLDKLQESAF